MQENSFVLKCLFLYISCHIYCILFLPHSLVWSSSPFTSLEFLPLSLSGVLFPFTSLEFFPFHLSGVLPLSLVWSFFSFPLSGVLPLSLVWSSFPFHYINCLQYEYDGDQTKLIAAQEYNSTI